LSVVRVCATVVAPVTVGGAVFDGATKPVVPEELGDDASVPLTYADTGHAADVRPDFHVDGSALSEVWAEFSLRQVPLETSRKDRAPPVPKSASQYLPPDATVVDVIAIVFQAPLVGERLLPDASSLPG
jgi:hypothetical protein